MRETSLGKVTSYKYEGDQLWHGNQLYCKSEGDQPSGHLHMSPEVLIGCVKMKNPRKKPANRKQGELMGLLLSVSPLLSDIVGSNFFVASHLYLQGKTSIPTTAKLKLWFK